MVAAYLKCMMMVSSFYHLPLSVLPAIQNVEGGRPGLVSTNVNGTQDLGVMQINTRWINPLMRMTHENGAVIYQRLKQDSCYNIAVAGAILRSYLAETKGNLMQAIGNYHSHTPAFNIQYRLKIIQAAYFWNTKDTKTNSISHSPVYQRHIRSLQLRKKQSVKNKVK